MSSSQKQRQCYQKRSKGGVLKPKEAPKSKTRENALWQVQVSDGWESNGPAGRRHQESHSGRTACLASSLRRNQSQGLRELVARPEEVVALYLEELHREKEGCAQGFCVDVHPWNWPGHSRSDVRHEGLFGHEQDTNVYQGRLEFPSTVHVKRQNIPEAREGNNNNASYCQCSHLQQQNLCSRSP